MPRISTLSSRCLVCKLVVLLVLFLGAFSTFAVAHHDNEAEHKVTAAVSATSVTTATTVTTAGAPDLPPTTSWTATRTTATTTTMSEQPPSTLKIETISIPDNVNQLPKAAKNDRITVHYTGTLWSNGNKFDSSHDRNKPFPVTLGVGQVIQGWDEGIAGMVVGERRKLTIPPNKAYGSRGFDSIIPPHSTLVFDVELLALQKAEPAHGEL